MEVGTTPGVDAYPIWPLVGVSIYYVIILAFVLFERFMRRRLDQLLERTAQGDEVSNGDAAKHSRERLCIMLAHAVYLKDSEFISCAHQLGVPEDTAGKTGAPGSEAKELQKLLRSTPLRRLFDVAFVIHNWVLSLGSLVAFIACFCSLFEETLEHGLSHMYCSRIEGEVWFWSYVFYLSKYYELIDTLFLVLRNPCTVLAQHCGLHIIHHSIVPFLFWLYLWIGFSGQWVQVLFNLGVHVIMYHYFALVTLYPGRRIWWRRYVTSLQIAQFVLDMVVTLPWMVIPECRRRLNNTPYAWQSWAIGYGVGFLFLCLFWPVLFPKKPGKSTESKKEL